MKPLSQRWLWFFSFFAIALSITLPIAVSSRASEPSDDPSLKKATIDGNGPGWVTLGEKDFVPVNGAPDTWSWKDGILHDTGKPTGVMRTQKEYTNFELVGEWNFEEPGGNSGFFVWTAPEALKDLKPGQLPTRGFEVQVLDHAFKTQWEQKNKAKATWFTTNGDVFKVGTATWKPFTPTSPDGSRSFPRKNLSKAAGEWNHYYVRAINGEIRLWVNGEEVSGGNHCDPKTGYLCIEAEGAPINYKNIRLRELP
jgi:hypothetical protein